MKILTYILLTALFSPILNVHAQGPNLRLEKPRDILSMPLTLENLQTLRATTEIWQQNYLKQKAVFDQTKAKISAENNSSPDQTAIDQIKDLSASISLIKTSYATLLKSDVDVHTDWVINQYSLFPEEVLSTISVSRSLKAKKWTKSKIHELKSTDPRLYDIALKSYTYQVEQSQKIDKTDLDYLFTIYKDSGDAHRNLIITYLPYSSASVEFLTRQLSSENEQKAALQKMLTWRRLDPSIHNPLAQRYLDNKRPANDYFTLTYILESGRDLPVEYRQPATNFLIGYIHQIPSNNTVELGWVEKIADVIAQWDYELFKQLPNEGFDTTKNTIIQEKINFFENQIAAFGENYLEYYR